MKELLQRYLELLDPCVGGRTGLQETTIWNHSQCRFEVLPTLRNCHPVRSTRGNFEPQPAILAIPREFDAVAAPAVLGVDRSQCLGAVVLRCNGKPEPLKYRLEQGAGLEDNGIYRSIHALNGVWLLSNAPANLRAS
jgi:hypothetical protein